MKKWLIVFLVALVVALSAFYLLIPSTIDLSRHVVIDCSIDAANRYLLQPRNWIKWWPGKRIASETSDQDLGKYELGEVTYTIKNLFYNRVRLMGSTNGKSFESFLNSIPLSRDTLTIQWKLQLKTSINPFKRLREYRSARLLEKNIVPVLDALYAFLHDKDKVYGIKLQRILNGERSLLVMDSVLPAQPTMKQVYAIVEELRKVMRKSGAQEINYPMLHVNKQDSNHYFMMVAVQTDIKIDRTGHIFYKHTYPGYTLLSQIKGGPHEVDAAIAQMQTYVQDYQIVSPAIPYAEMVTDRLKVTDTSQWVSRVYLPVF